MFYVHDFLSSHTATISTKIRAQVTFLKFENAVIIRGDFELHGVIERKINQHLDLTKT